MSLIQETGKIGLWMYRNDGGDYIHERLKRALEERGHTVISDFDMRECYCYNSEVFTKDGVNLSELDLFYHMNADEQTLYQNDILKALEDSGVRVVPNWKSFSTAKDKFTTNLLLRKNGIDVPSALLINNTQLEKKAAELFDRWGKMVLKPRRNHGGKGIMLFEECTPLLDFLQATEGLMDSFYLEQFIPFGLQDMRVEVFQNEVIGGYSRKKSHSFKTNVTSGGLMTPNPPPIEFQEIALRATRVIGIETTIVDMIKSVVDDKIYILEVNPIMGIFVESGIRYSDKSVVKTIHKDFANDDFKLSKLVSFLDKEAKKGQHA